MGRSVEEAIEEINKSKSEQVIRDIVVGCELSQEFSKKEYNKLLEAGRKRLNELDWGT